MTPPHLRVIAPLVAQIHYNHNRRSQVPQEETSCLRPRGHITISHGKRPSPELRCEHEAVEDESDPATHHTGLRDERKFVQRAPLNVPGAAEADVREADGGPCENGAESREGEHPVEDGVLLVAVGGVGDEAESGGEGDGDDGTALAVDVAEDLGGLALVGEGGEGA
ncbi:hypothetical protein O988_05469 [Pseudogymnoascus sp. VKM F-3808]|nr:hypothetical protein O988_05469 [Pseudogymnoascus sp. VKM F-3808]